MTADDSLAGHRCRLSSRTPHTATCLRRPYDDGNDWAVLLVVKIRWLRRQRATDATTCTPGSSDATFDVTEPAADRQRNPRRGTMSPSSDGSRRITPTSSTHPDIIDPNGSQQAYGSDPTLIRPTPTGTTVDRQETPARGQRQDDTRPAPPAKTSAAAAFALVFGLVALFCALTAILAPAAVVFGIIGLILAVAGLKMTKRPGITGKSVAVGGLITALLGLIGGGVVIGGVATVLNNKSQLDRIQNYLDKQEAKLPSTGQVRNSLPGQ